MSMDVIKRALNCEIDSLLILTANNNSENEISNISLLFTSKLLHISQYMKRVNGKISLV